jgi:hypothetical protein
VLPLTPPEYADLHERGLRKIELMRNGSSLLVPVLLVPWLAACVSQGTPVGQPTNGAKPGPAAAAPARKSAQPAKMDAHTRSLTSGYRTVKRNDQVLYCRSEKVTGTSFKNTICLTEAQLKEQYERMRTTADDLQNSTRAAKCVAPPCS